MNETAAILEPGFSVADAAYPAFCLRNGEVLLEFTDWRERKVRVRFTNAAGLKWQELDSAGPENRADAAFEIVGSAWFADCLTKGARTPADQLRHYRRCFNASGARCRCGLDEPGGCWLI